MRNWKLFKGNFYKLSVIGNLLRVVLTRFLLDDLSSYSVSRASSSQKENADAFPF